MILRRVQIRLAGLALLGWIVCEMLLFYAATRTIGVLPPIGLMALKGFAGLALLVFSMRRAFAGVLRAPGRRGLYGGINALFAAAGAGLILLPGFLASLAGLALFSPSVRSALLRRIVGGRRRDRDRSIITLDRREWADLTGEEGPRPDRGGRLPP